MSNPSVIPVFRSHYSISSSLLTLEEPGRAKAGNPLSVFDLAARAGLTQVFLHDRRVDGFLQAYKSAAKARVQLCYGLTFTVCSSMADKTPDSRRTESRATVLFLNSAAYGDAIKIWNRAWGREGHFTYRDESYGRADWTLLKSFWTPNLGLALPFFSSFVARNTLTMSQIVPDLPVRPWVLKEVGGGGLPFSPLIDGALDRYVKEAALEDRVIPMKTVLYPDAASFKAYITVKAIHNRSTFGAPEEDHLSSDQFGFDAWEKVRDGGAVAAAALADPRAPC